MFIGLVMLGALGALSILPPYAGPPLGLELDVPSDVEVVDHVIAGGTVAVFSLLAAWLLRTERIRSDSPVLIGAIAIAVLGAVWQTTSHVPLILDGGEPQSPWDTVLFHSTLGPVLTAVSLALLWRVLLQEPEAERRAKA